MTKEEAIKHLHTYSSTNGSGLTTQDQHEEAKKIAIKALETQPEWIPVTEQLPENEQEVFVTVEVRPFGRKPFRRVVRAFYTDGRHTDADSAYSWDEFPDPQYDDDDNMIIPEGWWESSDYLEQQGMIDDFVIAWREPLKPWEGDANDT